MKIVYKNVWAWLCVANRETLLPDNKMYCQSNTNAVSCNGKSMSFEACVNKYQASERSVGEGCEGEEKSFSSFMQSFAGSVQSQTCVKCL